MRYSVINSESHATWLFFLDQKMGTEIRYFGRVDFDANSIIIILLHFCSKKQNLSKSMSIKKVYHPFILPCPPVPVCLIISDNPSRLTN